MSSSEKRGRCTPGPVPVAVVMISLNEAHNMREVLDNLKGFAQEIILVDSYSVDETVSIALEYGVRVVQRRFRGFGDQWNFAVNQLTINAPWTMKVDPDERLSDELKENIRNAVEKNEADGFSFERRLWFMGKVLPVRQKILRVWRTGKCNFTNVTVNEHPIVDGRTVFLAGVMEHRDSPDLEHWLEKQNRYTTAEAITSYRGSALADIPKLFGTTFQRRMWLKKNFDRIPLRFFFLFLYHYIAQGAIKAGWPGYAWARMRIEVMRQREYKTREMKLTGRLPVKRVYGAGSPDPRVPQLEMEMISAPKVVPRGSAYHENLAEIWTEKYESGSFLRRIQRFKELLHPVVRDGSDWLDAGCGSGVLSNQMASLGARVIAVDASPRMIRHALAANFQQKDRIEFRLIESIEALPFSDELFDGCVCSSVIEYLDQPSLALSEISRVIKSGSAFIVSVSNKISIVRASQRIFRKILLLCGFDKYDYLEFSVNSYGLTEFKNELEGSGFKVISVSYFDPILLDIKMLKPFSSLIIYHAVKNKTQ